MGYTRTLRSANITGLQAQRDWSLLESQASAGNIDLIARGTIQQQIHGLLYQTSTGNYISDTSTVYTRAQLESFIATGDILSIMGVYPGTGTTH